MLEIIELLRTHQNGKNLTPSPIILRRKLAASAPPPIRTYTYPSGPLSNENLFKYPINNSIKKKTVEHLRDRKIIIASVFVKQ